MPDRISTQVGPLELRRLSRDGLLDRKHHKSARSCACGHDQRPATHAALVVPLPVHIGEPDYHLAALQRLPRFGIHDSDTNLSAHYTAPITTAEVSRMFRCHIPLLPEASHHNGRQQEGNIQSPPHSPEREQSATHYAPVEDRLGDSRPFEPIPQRHLFLHAAFLERRKSILSFVQGANCAGNSREDKQAPRIIGASSYKVSRSAWKKRSRQRGQVRRLIQANQFMRLHLDPMLSRCLPDCNAAVAE